MTERTGVDVNGVWDGSLIDKAARWLEERNGYPEARPWLIGSNHEHCRRHATFTRNCPGCQSRRHYVRNRAEILAAKRQRSRRLR